MGSSDTVYGKENDSDKFGYYARAVAEILTEDDDDKVDDSKKLNVSFSSISPFGQALGSGISELKRERLKILLRQSVIDLKPKVDEVLLVLLFFILVSITLWKRKYVHVHIPHLLCGSASL